VGAHNTFVSANVCIQTSDSDRASANSIQIKEHAPASTRTFDNDNGFGTNPSCAECEHP
jgi:hypothetical protein